LSRLVALVACLIGLRRRVRIEGRKMAYKTIRSKNIEVTATPGATIDDAIEESIRLAGDLGALVSLRFNGKIINCDPWDTVSQRLKEYWES
jgi:hypothetical protein